LFVAARVEPEPAVVDQVGGELADVERPWSKRRGRNTVPVAGDAHLEEVGRPFMVSMILCSTRHMWPPLAAQNPLHADRLASVVDLVVELLSWCRGR